MTNGTIKLAFSAAIASRANVSLAKLTVVAHVSG
jgi:hypothetical protein